MFLNFIIKIKIGDLEMRRESFRGGGIDLKSCFFFIIISRAENNFILCFKL